MLKFKNYAVLPGDTYLYDMSNLMAVAASWYHI